MIGKIIKNAGTKGLPAGAGAIGATLVVNHVAPMIPFVKDYPKFHGIVPFLVGAWLSDKKGIVEYAGVGMMGNSVQHTVGSFVPALAGYSDGDINDVLNDVITDADKAAAEYVKNLMKTGVNDEVNDEMNEEVNEEVNEDVSDEMN